MCVHICLLCLGQAAHCRQYDNNLAPGEEAKGICARCRNVLAMSDQDVSNKTEEVEILGRRVSPPTSYWVIPGYVCCGSALPSATTGGRRSATAPPPDIGLLRISTWYYNNVFVGWSRHTRSWLRLREQSLGDAELLHLLWQCIVSAQEVFRVFVWSIPTYWIRNAWRSINERKRFATCGTLSRWPGKQPLDMLRGKAKKKDNPKYPSAVVVLDSRRTRRWKTTVSLIVDSDPRGTQCRLGDEVDKYPCWVWSDQRGLVFVKPPVILLMFMVLTCFAASPYAPEDWLSCISSRDDDGKPLRLLWLWCLSSWRNDHVAEAFWVCLGNMIIYSRNKHHKHAFCLM